MEASSSSSVVTVVAEVGSGRGRGLVASQALLPGQVLLRESPLLLYLESSSDSSSDPPFCSHCLRPSPPPSPCPSCQVALFCSPSCASSHTPFACRALSFLVLCTLDADCQNQARFLIAAYSLAVTSPASFEQLMLLEGDGSADEKVQLVYTFLCEVVRSSQLQCQSLPSWSLEFVASLLAKDQRNAFGLIASVSKTGERKVRAYAIYAQASFINHNCLPNACRFDHIDKTGVGNTDLVIRALHDIAEGTEICISYFPVNWSYTERQKKLKEEYGFDCTCERCKIEENWSDEDTAELVDEISMEGEDYGGDEEMQSSEKDEMDADDKIQDTFPHAMFFVKYLCPQEHCGGTLAPLPPLADKVSSVMECNVCGQLRTAEAFLEELKEHEALC